MDVDDMPDTPPFLVEWIHLFDLSPETFAWRDPIPQEIEARRAQMSDKLIFDVLLASAGIQQADTLFPPTDVASLRRLLDAIQSSGYDTLKKDCVVYWLLKWHQDGKAKRFQESRGIPPQFVTLADAFWLLDTAIDVERAVSMLADVRITPDYPSKVLQALSLSDNPHQLIVKYVRTAKPSLREPDDVDLYTLALAESCPSLLEAWQFQRTFPESDETRSRLITKILDWCLSPKPRSAPLTQLLVFPLSKYEQSIIQKYALHPPLSCPLESIPVVQDLVCVRLVQSGQYSAAIKLDRQFLSSVSKPSGKMQKAIQDRKRMMDDIMAAMPQIERETLEVELEQLAQGMSGTSISTAGSRDSWTNVGNNTSMWEDPPSAPNMNGSAAPARPLAQLFGAVSSTPAVERSDMHSGTPAFGSVMTGAPSRPNRNSPMRNLPSSGTLPILPTAKPSHTFGASLPSGSSALNYSPLRFSHNPAPRDPQPIASTSLFNSAGSANFTPNAFYKPPVVNGIKRPFGQDSSRAPPVINQPTPPPDDNDDMNMDADTDEPARPPAGGNEPPSELSYSLFGTSKTDDSRRVTRALTETRLPPGAYVESDEEREEVPPPRHNARRRPSPPPSLVQESAFTRSIPGGLLEEEEEGEDYVAPLPASRPSKRPARKGRATQNGSIDSEEDVQQSRPRRSTRLSVASSSSEPTTSKKSSLKSTRTSATGTGTSTAKSGKRKTRS